MSVTISLTPASGSILATKTAVRVDLAGLDANDTTAFDAGAYPTSPEVRYYLTFEKGGAILGKSYVFAPNGGMHTFNNYIFPSSGSWTVRVSKASDDSSVQTAAATVV